MNTYWTKDWCGTVLSITEIVPKSQSLCVNRSTIWYDFHAGVKAVWWSVNIAQDSKERNTLQDPLIHNDLQWGYDNFLALGWGSSDKIKLTDVNVITLQQGKMTNSHRTHPVPQLQCVGGTAGCSAFTPRVVQCYNRGSDGYDVQVQSFFFLYYFTHMQTSTTH